MMMLTVSMGATVAAQSPTPQGQADHPPANPPAANAPAPGYADLLQPSIQTLHDTVTGLRLEKWKGGNVREEAARDSSSILDDLDKTLPGLIHDADAAPLRVSSALPLWRNGNALYAVSLRVLDAARIAAPADQAAKMQDAVNILAGANKSLYDRIVSAAAAQETQIGNLDTQLKAQTEAAQAAAQQVKVVQDCPAPPVKKAVRKKKTAAKQGNTQNGAAQKPAAGQTQQKPQ